MSDRKFTDKEAADIIENEGLGYAVTSYTRGSSMKNPKTAKLWDAAAAALKALSDHLGVDD